MKNPKKNGSRWLILDSQLCILDVDKREGVDVILDAEEDDAPRLMHDKSREDKVWFEEVMEGEGELFPALMLSSSAIGSGIDSNSKDGMNFRCSLPLNLPVVDVALEVAPGTCIIKILLEYLEFC